MKAESIEGDELARDRRPRRPSVTIALGVSLLGLVAVALAAPRGFDLSDEGWYWLAARHPLDFVRSSTQFQFPLNDVFDVAGWNVAWARVLRLGLVGGASVVFLLGVLRAARGVLGIDPHRTTTTLLIAVVIAAPFASTWYPPSPSYNDLALMAVLISCGALLQLVEPPSRSVTGRVVWSFVAGAAAWFLLMIKFSALGAPALTAIAVLVMSWASWNAAKILTAVVAVLVGFGAAALFWQVRYLSIADTIDGMRVGLDETSGSIHSPTTLLGAAVTGVGILALLALIVFVGARAARRWPRLVVTLAVAAAIGAVWLANLVLEATRRSAAVALLVPCALAFGAFLAAPSISERWRDLDSSKRRAWLAGGAVLVAIPPLYSFGTANPLLNGATPATVVWLVLLVLVAAVRPAAAYPDADPDRSRLWSSATIVISALAGVALIWISPYDQVDLRDSTTSFTPSSPISELTLDPQKASAIDDAIFAMDDAAGPGPRNLLTFFSLPGFAYATDATTPGLIFEPDEVTRTEGVIDRACAQRRPLFVATTAPLPHWVTERLESACDVDLPEALRPLTTVEAQGDVIDIALLERNP